MSSASIPDRFLLRSAQSPGALALFSPEVSYTYAELNQVSNRLAHDLLARLGRGQENVAILSTSPKAVVALMGVWKSGKCAVVLAPGFSVEKNRYILRSSGVRLLLAAPEDSAIAAGITGDTPVAVSNLSPDGLSTNPGICLTPDLPCVIIYTSGSTGDPKGVLVSHAYLLRMAQLNIDTQSLTPADHFLLSASLQTLTGLNSTLEALLVGGTVYWFDLAQRTVASLPAFLAQHRITVIPCTSTIFRSIAALDAPREQFATVRVVRLGGEPMLTGDVQAHATMMPAGSLLLNSFASSEAGSICRAVIGPDTPSYGEVTPAGFPTPGVEVTLEDPAGHSPPLGQSGEIVVHSRFLSLGYWNNPELTRASFHDHPDGRRSFHTGDLGMFLPNGMLVCLGRKDKQVKVRGNRVEPQEVEMALRKLAGVDAAAVVARPTPQHDHQLIAYVVPAPGRKLSAPLLRNALLPALPSFMIPSIFVLMDRLPLTHTGKLDRHALPDPMQGRHAVPYAAPRSNVEKRLAAFFAEVLAWVDIGIDDDFFSSGGDSLTAAQLIVLIQKEFELEMDLAALMHAPTVRQLAVWIAEIRPATAIVILQAHGSAKPFFCVHAGPLFLPLAAHLGPDRPFFGLPPETVSRLQPPYRLEDLAALYAVMIQETDPVGPYIIGGWCHAGLVAYAVACQLRAVGKEVELLVLFDAEPYTHSTPLSLARRVTAKAMFHAAEVYRLSWSNRFQYAAALLSGLVSRMSIRLWRWLFRLKSIAGQPPLPDAANLENIVSLMVRRYRPSPFDGRLLVVRNGDRPLQQFLDCNLGWKKFAPHMELLVTEGNHRSMFVEPNVALLGAELRSRLSAR